MVADAKANANADARGSTIALCERCSGELKMSSFKSNENIHKEEDGSYYMYVVSANTEP